MMREFVNHEWRCVSTSFAVRLLALDVQGSRSGPEDAGAYAGADEGAGPTPDSLRAAGELIEAHVNRLIAPRRHLLDDLDRCPEHFTPVA